jgi:hypothetical protein
MWKTWVAISSVQFNCMIYDTVKKSLFGPLGYYGQIWGAIAFLYLHVTHFNAIDQLHVPPCGLPSSVILLSSWMWVLSFCSLYSAPPFFWVLWFIYDWQGFISCIVFTWYCDHKRMMQTCQTLLQFEDRNKNELIGTANIETWDM